MFSRTKLVTCVGAGLLILGCSAGTNSPDTEPPAQVSDLYCDAVYPERAELSWTDTGDDGTEGVCAAYDLRYSASPIDESTWDAALAAPNVPVPSASGGHESAVVNGLDSGVVYYFALKARDNVGNWSALSNVAIGDKTAPEARITNLSDDQVLSGTVMISGEASDNHEIAQVEFLVDWAPLAVLANAPWSFDWNCSTVGDGSHHTIRCRATDAAGNMAYSDPVHVTVQSDVTDSIEPDVIVLESGYGDYAESPRLVLRIEDAGGSGFDPDSLVIDVYAWTPFSSDPLSQVSELRYVWFLDASTLKDVQISGGNLQLNIDFRAPGMSDPLYMVIYDGIRTRHHDETCGCDVYTYDHDNGGVPDLSGNHTSVVEEWLPGFD